MIGVAPQAFAESRSRTYWLLSELYLNPPDEAFVNGLRERLGALAREAGDDLPASWGALCAGLDADATETLAVEHTRLFGGLRAGEVLAPPYESVHRESRLLGDTALAVLRDYAGAGFGVIFHPAGPQDHIGVELRFVSLAAHEEMEAWLAGERAAATSALERQVAFLDQHLLAWAPAYGRALSIQARTAFHTALGALTVRVLADDRDLVRVLLADLVA